MRAVCFSFIAALLTTSRVAAQVRADPGVVIGNRIAVRVNVTLADEETPYSPVRNLSLAFTRAGADTVFARTDEAGVITVMLPRGDYVVSTRQPYEWKSRWFTWSVPITVRADMPAVELNRGNAVANGSSVQAKPNASASQSAGDSTPPTGSTRSGDSSIPWLSLEVGGEGGLTRLDADSGSDAGYGGSASFIGGLGPLALGLGYRYTSIRYGKGLDNGSMRSGIVEVRYHFRPGAAPVRPYIGVLASFGRWYESESVSDESSDMRMFGGSGGVQFGLATSVRLHVAATVAGTHVKGPEQTSSNGVFATMNVGLTFDIFSPAR
jgi:hypothetical protein